MLESFEQRSDKLADLFFRVTRDGVLRIDLSEARTELRYVTIIVIQVRNADALDLAMKMKRIDEISYIFALTFHKF